MFIISIQKSALCLKIAHSQIELNKYPIKWSIIQIVLTRMLGYGTHVYLAILFFFQLKKYFITVKKL